MQSCHLKKYPLGIDESFLPFSKTKDSLIPKDISYYVIQSLHREKERAYTFSNTLKLVLSKYS